MKYLIFIFCFILFHSISYATVCDFSGFEKNNNNVYWITQCDNKHSDIIPFADYDSFVIDSDNSKIASDYNYNYNQNFVISKSDWKDFVALNQFIYTDRKNVFIKTQDMYLFIDKYKFDTKIFTIYESKNAGRYLLTINNNVYNINLTSGYFSYSSGLHKITNIADIKNLTQISKFIFTDGKNFYSTFIEEKSNVGMNFGFDIPTAHFFSSNKKQLFNIDKIWKNIITLNYNDDSKKKLNDVYNKLDLIKNPYTWENQNILYNEFFIKKELILHYLWIILNK